MDDRTAVARALHKLNCPDCDPEALFEGRPAWAVFEDDADAAIAALSAQPTAALLAEAVSALTDAIAGIEQGRLDERMCCNGRECGCQGSTNADFMLHCLRATLAKIGAGA